MAINQLETDYLVVGAGAMGMAFVDEMLTRTRKINFILVDKYPRPGGHWNTAYSFVRLHQPSAFYGVNSLKLEEHGSEFASQSEILSYYERVLEKFIASGRVTFLSQCEYTGDGRIHSTVDNQTEYQVTIRKRLVDATYMKVEVPSTRPPRYEVADQANLVPINALSSLTKSYTGYVVIGAGKTGIDAVLYLLNQGVDPSTIRWVINRDVWYYNRASVCSDQILDLQINTFRAILEGNSVTEIFQISESKGNLLKLDSRLKPKVFRCATITAEERDQVCQIGEMIRLGYVQKIEADRIVLDQGTVPTSPDILHVDCTANGLMRRPAVPIFQDKKIVLQPMFTCQQVFSAAVIAMIEVLLKDDQQRNKALQASPHPNTPAEWLDSIRTSLQNLDALRPILGFKIRMRLYPLGQTPFLSWFWKSITVMLPMVPKVIDAIPKILAENEDI